MPSHEELLALVREAADVLDRMNCEADPAATPTVGELEDLLGRLRAAGAAR
jgi:hypothetical protein